MLFRMKDEEGKSWSEIRDAWEKMTGNEVTVNLVKKRYYRLKAAFTVFNDDDVSSSSPLFRKRKKGNTY